MSLLLGLALFALLVSILAGIVARAFDDFSFERLEEIIARAAESRRARLHALARQVAERGERTALSGYLLRSLANVALSGLVVAWLLLDRPERPRTWLIVAVLAGFVLLVEVVPRLVAAAWAEPIILRFGRAARRLLLPLWPLARLLEVLSRASARRGGRPEPEGGAEELEHEVRELVREAEGVGGIEVAKARLLRAVFHLRRLNVADVMTPRPEIHCSALADGAAGAMAVAAESGYTRIPIYESNRDNVVGVFHVRDLLPYWPGAPAARAAPPPAAGGLPELRAVLRVPVFVPESRPLDRALQDMLRARMHLAIVVDEYGGTAGLVTLEDILEELIGDIKDEHDVEEPSAYFRRVNERTLEVEAWMRLGEVNELLDVRLPDDGSYDSLGGLVVSRLGRIPAAGEELACGNVRLTVLTADERRVLRLRVERLPEAAAASGGGAVP